MIRPARAEDVPVILRMGKAFFDEAPWPEFAEWDEASTRLTLEMLIDGRLPGVLLAAEKDGTVIGMAACLLFPLYFNHATSAAQEIFWWIEPEYRRGIGAIMFDELEHTARSKGAEIMFAESTAGLRDQAVGRLYRMRGYKPAGHTFMKRL
jgi:GNAT superfamily N-acetyltransferase